MLCSSLDVTGATELAVEAYLTDAQQPKSPQDTDDGKKYLTLYGILQVLFVQQDAVKHISKALGIKYTPDSVLVDIRETRNDAVGHPTNRRGGKFFNFISRQSLSLTHCKLLTMPATGEAQFRDIDVPSMITDQRQAVLAALTSVVAKLREDERTHRETFRRTKLADAFSGMAYRHEKISGAISGTTPVILGIGMLEEVASDLNQFEKALRDRGPIEAYDTVMYDLARLEYPIEKLKGYLSQSPDSTLNQSDAEIMHFFIFKTIEDLCDVVRYRSPLRGRSVISSILRCVLTSRPEAKAWAGNASLLSHPRLPAMHTHPARPTLARHRLDRDRLIRICSAKGKGLSVAVRN